MNPCTVVSEKKTNLRDTKKDYCWVTSKIVPPEQVRREVSSPIGSVNCALHSVSQCASPWRLRTASLSKPWVQCSHCEWRVQVSHINFQIISGSCNSFCQMPLKPWHFHLEHFLEFPPLLAPGGSVSESRDPLLCRAQFRPFAKVRTIILIMADQHGITHAHISLQATLCFCPWS